MLYSQQTGRNFKARAAFKVSNLKGTLNESTLRALRECHVLCSEFTAAIKAHNFHFA